MARHDDQSGFTLVETMVALSIFVAVMTLIFGQLTSGVRRTSDIDQATMANTTARIVLESLTSELRQASTSDATLAAVPQMVADAITFYTPDRSSPMHLVKVSYRLNAGTLERRSVVSTNAGTGPWSFPAGTPNWIPLLRGVLNTDLFTYVGQNGAVATDSGSLRVVQVHVVVASGMTDPAQMVYRLDISLRSQQ